MNQTGWLPYIRISSSLPEETKHFIELTNQYMKYIRQATNVLFHLVIDLCLLTELEPWFKTRYLLRTMGEAGMNSI